MGDVMRKYIALENIDAGCVVVVDPEKRTVRKSPYIARGVDVLNQSRNIPDWAWATPPEHTNRRSVRPVTPESIKAYREGLIVAGLIIFGLVLLALLP